MFVLLNINHTGYFALFVVSEKVKMVLCYILLNTAELRNLELLSVWGVRKTNFTFLLYYSVQGLYNKKSQNKKYIYRLLKKL